MRGKLNIRFLLIVTAVCGVFAVGWFFLHRYQKNRKLGDYLTQAVRAEEEQKYDRASRLLRAYVLLAPADIDAKLRYAKLIEEHVPTVKGKVDALGLYEQVLAQDPDRQETRRHAAEIAIQLGRIDAAFEHLKILQQSFPKDGQVLLLTGICLEARKRYDEAAAKYEESRQVDPKPEAFARLATVYRTSLRRPDDADRVMNELVERLPNSYESYLTRAAFYWIHDRDNHLQSTRKDAEEALKRAPDQPEVLLLNATIALDLAGSEATDAAERTKHLDRARGDLTHGIEKNPKLVALPLLLADVEARAGRREEAIRVLREAKKQVPAAAQPEILFALAEHCTDAGDFAGSEDAVEQLRDMNQSAVKIDYVVARRLVKQGKWVEGSGILERIRPLLGDEPAKALQADLLLAGCYGQMAENERQLSAYSRAALAAPLDPRPRLGLAATYVSLGRTSEAIAEYERLTQMRGTTVGAWLSLARLRVYQTLSLPEADRKWNEVVKLLDAVEKSAPDALDVVLLRAEVLAAQGDNAGARRLLTDARVKHPKAGELWFALARLAHRNGDSAGAAAALDDAAQQLGDSVDLRLTRIRLVLSKSVEEATRGLQQLVQGAEKFPPDDRARLFQAIAGGYWILGNPAEASRLWKTVAELRPGELHVRMLLFDAALLADDESAMTRILDDIKQIEGDGPIHMYGEATRLIWRAGRGDRTGLAEARRLLTAAGARRPGWTRIPLGLARIDEIEGDAGRALESYRLAVQYGERQTNVIRRLVQLLYERQQYAEADEVLRGLQARAPISDDLARLAAEVSLRNLNPDRALELARQAVPSDSKDYKERIWLGQILSATGRGVEAEKEFRQAIDLAPDQPDPWVALILHHARRKESQQGEAVIKQAEEKLGGSEKGLLAMAQCYELLGQRDKAIARFQAVVKANPHEPGALRGAAQFYLTTGASEQSEPLLRSMLAPEAKAQATDLIWARRNLALITGLKGDEKGLGEAITLLDQNAARGETADDLRTRGMLFASRPARRREAIELFEKAEKVQPPRPDHEFILARLYEADGDWPKARERMLRLVGLKKDNSGYIASFANSLIRRGEWLEAEVWVGRLREIAPHSLIAIRLQVQVWTNRNRTTECTTLIREYAEAKDGDPVDPAARIVAAADLMEGVSLMDAANTEAALAAEQYYSKYRDLTRKPESELPLAAYYGRHNQPNRALALCDRAIQAGCPIDQVAAVAASAVVSDSATDGHLQTVEGWVRQARTAKPESEELQFLFGTLRDRQRQFADAEAAYRALLARNPRHLGAMNNLAILLALTGKATEGEKFAREAVALAQTQNENLLDTRALVFIAAGKFEEARKDLEAAISLGGGGSAMTHYHRAVAYHKLHDKAKAQAAFKLAQEKRFRPSLLHPLERPMYEELVARLGK